MTSGQTDIPPLDLTADGVEFAAWPTLVQDDHLDLSRLCFDVGSPRPTYAQRQMTHAPVPSGALQSQELEAIFVSIEKRAEIRFGFSNVVAFRVLDEGGLLELWDASAISPRPAGTTFRARGHAWTKESFIIFLGQGQKPRYSYFVATNSLCLEVICNEEPIISEVGPAVTEG